MRLSTCLDLVRTLIGHTDGSPVTTADTRIIPEHVVEGDKPFCLPRPPQPPPAAIVNGFGTLSRLATMAPPSRLHYSATATGYTEPAAQLPPLSRSVTAPTPFRAPAAQPSQQTQGRPDPSHLAPEDAFLATSPPRRTNGFETSGNGDLLPRHLRRRTKEAGSRSRSRRRKRPWKKLLWVKQPCESPDEVAA